MNLLSIPNAKSFTKLLLFCFFSIVQVSVKAWEVDMSRRQKELTTSRIPASVVDEPLKKQDSLLGGVFESVDPSQDIVILNTDKGFVPATVRMKKGQRYQIHIVNINATEKNSSFIMDSFSEHHATYFGQEKSFTISPKAEGVFSFQCPETAKEGKIVVVPNESGRTPASTN